MGHDEFAHYYYAQAIFRLGDDGWEKLFPRTPPEDQVTWSRYRKIQFDHFQRTQEADGRWKDGGAVGPVYATAVNLTILQLDKTRRGQPLKPKRDPR